MSSLVDSETVSALFADADSDDNGMLIRWELQTAMASHHGPGHSHYGNGKSPDTE